MQISRRYPVWTGICACSRRHRRRICFLKICSKNSYTMRYGETTVRLWHRVSTNTSLFIQTMRIAFRIIYSLFYPLSASHKCKVKPYCPQTPRQSVRDSGSATRTRHLVVTCKESSEEVPFADPIHYPRILKRFIWILWPAWSSNVASLIFSLSEHYLTDIDWNLPSTLTINISHWGSCKTSVWTCLNNWIARINAFCI